MKMKKVKRLLILSLFLLFGYGNAQGPMVQPDPEDSPQQPPNATLVFGDVALTPEQLRAKELGPESFNAVIGQHLRWKDAIIPYKIDCSIENLPRAIAAIHKAIAQWERKTCIRFVPYTNQKYHLTFFRNTHCWGNVGQVSYSRISVGPGCEYEHVMAHEIGHVVGLHHEHQRPDRDDWVKVIWENIGQFRDAFTLVKNTDPLGIQYDYESIMHYPWTAFSINGKITMQPKKDTKGKIPYIEISKDDIELVSRMYNCPAIERKRKHHANRLRKRIAKLQPNLFDKRDCVDKIAACEDWAKSGQCQIESVKINCHRSCGAPSCFGGPCTDLHPECPRWKQRGHCKEVDSVQEDCQLSCNPACKGGPHTLPPTEKPKTEKPKSERPKPVTTAKPRTKFTGTYPPRPFPTEAPHKKGDFHSWPNYNYLGTGMRCLDRKTRCKEWADKGECETNSRYMLHYCKKSCKKARCDREVLKPPGTCNEPLGLSVGLDGKWTVPDSAFKATSTLTPGGGWKASAENARLYYEDDYKNRRIASWCPKYRNNQHITVDLGSKKTITYIATQGRDKYFERISKFLIQYSDDGVSFKTFQENGKDREFFGNCDHLTPVLNKFENTLKARYVRYLPTESNWPCVRMEFYGC